MKCIAGAILLLVALVYNVYALDTTCGMTNTGDGSGGFVFNLAQGVSAIILGVAGVFHFILGLYFLFAKDKPKT